MYGIFQGVYFGEYETENYKFGLVQLAVTPASFAVLTTMVLFNIVGINRTSKFTFYLGPQCHTIIIDYVLLLLPTLY